MTMTANDDLVVHTRDMDDDDFAKHMTIRHRDSLGGLEHLWPTEESVMLAWRAFHRRLHALRLDIPHSHEEDDDDHDWQG